MTQHHRSVRLLVGLLATLALAVGLLAAPANAASSSKVKGVVTLSGKPLAGAKVTLVRGDKDSGDTFEPYKTVTTNSAGAYSFSVPTSADWFYRNVIVQDPKHRAVSTARAFTSKPNKTVTRNVTMKAAGSISGKITRADGSSPTATRVQIFGPPTDLPIDYAEINFAAVYDDESVVSSDGTYHFVGLPAGTYTIGYYDTTTKYLVECYDDALVHESASYYCDSAPKVTVKAGTDVPLAEQQLNHRGARLSGAVTDTSGHPIKDIVVTPYRTGANGATWYADTSTRRSGRFALAPIDSGNWQLRITDNLGVWEPRWYNSTTRSGARVFNLAEGTSIKDLAIKLKSRAKVSVTSKPGRGGKVVFTVRVTRRATGKHASGKVTISRKDISSTVILNKGVAKVTLVGLPTGTRTFSVDYRGASSTAKAHKTVKARVR